jgi:hypothetical protein
MADKKRKKNEPLVQISTQVDAGTLLDMDKAAASLNMSRSEFMRRCINEGVKVKSYEDNIDMLTAIIRQEIKNEMVSVTTLANKGTERIVKLIIKMSKPLIANFFLHLRYLNEISPPDSLDDRINQSVRSSVDYMTSRDNDYLNDSSKLIKVSGEI